MNLNLSKKNITINALILLAVLIIVNIFYFKVVKDLENTEIKKKHKDYIFSIYISPTNELLQFNQIIKEIFGESLVSNYYSVGNRNEFDYYKEEISNLLTNEGFKEVFIENKKSAIFFYSINVGFKDTFNDEYLVVNEKLKNQLIDIILFMENKIFQRNFRILNLNYTLNQMEESLEEDRLFRNSTEWREQLTEANNYRFENSFRKEKRKINKLRYFHEYFEKNYDKALRLDRSSFYEKFVDNPDYYKRDLKRINLLNLNIGGILISLIIIFLNELRQNVKLKFNREKK